MDSEETPVGGHRMSVIRRNACVVQALDANLAEPKGVLVELRCMHPLHSDFSP